MHWGLMAQKDYKDVNLSTLRMLLIADGANPCKFRLKFSLQTFKIHFNFLFKGLSLHVTRF